ncbi:SdiA-regulated domain-containing protein [Citrobacter amalonaticus]|uniref:SdiA-regulated domain-containing protein n=1 Tax=Citrobacter amalonaticus TaxID=35703 RepID=UPI0020A5F608|nr:SdiA-regulated domain-containing protein [Citrobacter amalonaticus]
MAAFYCVYKMIVIYLKRLTLTTAFISAIFMYIREDIRYLYRLYEKYDDIPTTLHLSAYRAEIQAKPVEGVTDNLSGLTWSDKHRLLFAVVNNPPEIVWLTQEGSRIESLALPEIADPEAVEWVGDNLFRIGSEKDSVAWLVNIDIHARSYTIISKIELDDFDQPKNKGLEGLAWDKEKHRLFAAKEKKPLIISVIKIHNHAKEDIPACATASLKDVSGLHYHAATSSLLVLSDESKKVVEINTEGRTVDRLYLTAGWSGLSEDIPQAEGIALDDAGDLYIVSEPNLFYRFTKK